MKDHLVFFTAYVNLYEYAEATKVWREPGRNVQNLQLVQTKQEREVHLGQKVLLTAVIWFHREGKFTVGYLKFTRVFHKPVKRIRLLRFAKLRQMPLFEMCRNNFQVAVEKLTNWPAEKSPARGGKEKQFSFLPAPSSGILLHIHWWTCINTHIVLMCINTGW